MASEPVHTFELPGAVYSPQLLESVTYEIEQYLEWYRQARVQKQVGAKVSLGVVREKKERTVALVTQEKPNLARGAQERTPGQAPRAAASDLGLELEPLTNKLAARLGYAGRQGAVVASVNRGSTAERAGVRSGDLIVEADRKPVQSPADVTAALADGTALLRIQRGADSSFVVLSKDE